MKTFFIVSLDDETLFVSDSISEFKQEVRMKYYDDDTVLYAVQVEDYQTLEIQTWELIVMDGKLWELASEVILTDNYLMLDKEYILSYNF